MNWLTRIACRDFVVKQLLLAGVVAALAGCDKVEYHPYDGRISGATDINARNISKIESSCDGKDTVRFAVISDTQRYYDETHDLVKAINSRNDVDFVIHLGDLTDFGTTKEFQWMRDELQELSMPYVCLIGNHDCLGTGDYVFGKIFGDVNFSFTAGHVKFVCLNTNSREYDYTTAVPDFTFLHDEIASDSADAKVTATVVAMHAKPNSEQFDNNVKQIFENEIRKFKNLLFCLNGHEHRVTSEDVFNDGLIYYGCGDASDRSYLFFTICGSAYTYDVVEI